MVKMKLDELEPGITNEEAEEIEKASKMELVFDEDSPEMTKEQLMQFKRLNHYSRLKKNVSIRLSESTIQKAKSYGKGYTSFLSRLIDCAINDEAMVKKCL